MKKILSMLMVLTLIVMFALTWYCSRKTEQLFMDQVNALNQAVPALIKVDLQNYQRKLFSSTAQTTFHIQGKKEVSFNLNHQIRHFIWGVKIITVLEDAPELANSIETTVPLDEIQLITDISLQGGSKSALELPQLSFMGDGETLTVTGFKVNWNLNNDLTAGDFTCLFKGLIFQQGTREILNLDNLQIFSQVTGLQEVPLGSGKMSLGRLKLEQPGMIPIEFQDIQYQGLTELTQGDFSGTFDLNFARLLLAEEALSKGRIKLTLSGVDTELLKSLQQTARELQLKALDPQANPLELQIQLLGLYSKIFNSGITLSLEEVSLQSGDGGIKGSGVLTLVEDSASGGLFSPLENVNAKFQLDIDRTAFVTGYQILHSLQSAGVENQNPAVLAEQAEQIAGGLVQKGVFVRQDGDNFHVDFAWDEGLGTLNGEPLN